MNVYVLCVILSVFSFILCMFANAILHATLRKKPLFILYIIGVCVEYV